MSERALQFYSQLVCESVVSITWRDMVMVAVLLGVRREDLVTLHVEGWGGVGFGFVLWGGGKRWDMSYTAQTHIHHN